MGWINELAGLGSIDGKAHLGMKGSEGEITRIKWVGAYIYTADIDGY